VDELRRGHLEIVEQLPDYAGGSLDDAALDRIEAHLEGCPECRRELGHVLELVGLLGEVFPPERLRADLLRIATEAPAASPLAPPTRMAPPPLAVPSLAAPAAEGDAPRRPVSPAPAGVAMPAVPPAGATAPAVPDATPAASGSPGRVLRPAPSLWRRPALTTLAAAALLLAALGVWNLRLQEEVSDQAAIAALVAGATVSPLTDGDLFPAAAGVLFSADDRQQALLVTDGLPPPPPPPPPDRSYQLWLFDDEGGRTAGPRFAVDAAGRAEVVIEAPQPFAAYGAVAISAEPEGGSEEPSSPLALGGWIR